MPGLPRGIPHALWRHRNTTFIDLSLYFFTHSVYMSYFSVLLLLQSLSVLPVLFMHFVPLFFIFTFMAQCVLSSLFPFVNLVLFVGLIYNHHLEWFNYLMLFFHDLALTFCGKQLCCMCSLDESPVEVATGSLLLFIYISQLRDDDLLLCRFQELLDHE